MIALGGSGGRDGISRADNSLIQTPLAAPIPVDCVLYNTPERMFERGAAECRKGHALA
jgi:hypothetical protein